MAKIQSNSDLTAGKAKTFFLPTFSGAILFFLLGGILLLIYNSSRLVSWFSNNYLESAKKVELNVHILNNGFSNSFNSAFNGRLGQIIVWSVVGALAYICLWFFKNILNSFENDVIIDHYLHPTNFSRVGYWGSAFSGKIFFAAVSIVTIAFTFLSLKVIMPTLAALTNSSLNNFHAVRSIGYILLCILISTLVIYIWTLLVRTVVHLWKLL